MPQSNGVQKSMSVEATQNLLHGQAYKFHILVLRVALMRELLHGFLWCDLRFVNRKSAALALLWDALLCVLWVQEGLEGLVLISKTWKIVSGHFGRYYRQKIQDIQRSEISQNCRIDAKNFVRLCVSDSCAF